MTIRQIGTRFLALFRKPHACQNGPMRGEILMLSEYSTATAWLDINGQTGRYIADERGRLHWEKRR